MDLKGLVFFFFAGTPDPDAGNKFAESRARVFFDDTLEMSAAVAEFSADIVQRNGTVILFCIEEDFFHVDRPLMRRGILNAGDVFLEQVDAEPFKFNIRDAGSVGIHRLKFQEQFVDVPFQYFIAGCFQQDIGILKVMEENMGKERREDIIMLDQ